MADDAADPRVLCQLTIMSDGRGVWAVAAVEAGVPPPGVDAESVGRAVAACLDPFVAALGHAWSAARAATN
jgi:hypothetical protein